jgi:MATE family multidrug resistance protein
LFEKSGILIFVVPYYVPVLTYLLRNLKENISPINKMNHDLLRRFFRMTGINILANLAEPLAGLFAVAFLGHLTQIDDLAGVSLATILFNCIFESLLFLRISTTALTAQSVGKDDKEELLLVALRSAFIAVVIGVVIVILQYPIGVLGFSLLNGSSDVESSGLSYFYARIWGAPAVLLNFVILGWFLGREQNGKVLLLTALGNIVNVVLSYVVIIQWNLGSQGVGLSQTFSEYLTLLLGIILVIISIEWQILSKAIPKFWDLSIFRNLMSFNGDLLLKSFICIAIWGIFFALSAPLGTEILAENTLLQQIIYLIMYVIEAIGFTTETITGNLKGQDNNDELLSLLQISLIVSTIVGVLTSAVCVLLPEIIFGLLTNHHEIIEPIKIYTPWLFIVLICFSIAWILEGYFAGLANSKAPLNAAIIGLFIGFLPSAIWAWITHNNHLLWLAISAFMVTRLVVLLLQLLEIFSNDFIKTNQQKET